MSDKNKKTNTIFMGTPEFAVPSLRALINDGGFNILSVVTQPDKKAGRKQILTPPPVKIEAEKNGLKVIQPQKLGDITAQLKSLNPDLIIVIAYAKKITGEILSIPEYGVINVHGSLLPKYRGASCIQSAIIEGDGKTGVTVMKMDENIDTGPILSQAETMINPDDTYGSLYGKLSLLGAELLVPTIKKYINGEIQPQKQDDAKSSYSPILKKEDGMINWSDSAEKIERFVRAMDPWPSAWTRLDGKILKILEVKNEIVDSGESQPGKLFSHSGRLAVQCGKGALEIKKILLEGKARMDAKTFLHGYGNLIGSILG